MVFPKCLEGTHGYIAKSNVLRQAQGRLQEAEALYRQGLQDCQASRSLKSPKKTKFRVKKTILSGQGCPHSTWGDYFHIHLFKKTLLVIIHNKHTDHMGIKTKTTEAGIVIVIPRLGQNLSGIFARILLAVYKPDKPMKKSGIQKHVLLRLYTWLPFLHPSAARWNWAQATRTHWRCWRAWPTWFWCRARRKRSFCWCKRCKTVRQIWDTNILWPWCQCGQAPVQFLF